MTESHFKFLQTNIDVSSILKELQQNEALWDMVSKLRNVSGDTSPSGFLPLVMGVQEEGKTIRDSMALRKTDAWGKFPALHEFLYRTGFTEIARCAFFKLEPDGRVLSHIDNGQYYHSKDRFHLSLQGRYAYDVENERHIIDSGTLFWFDNKRIHRAHNISNVDRITFVFDVPYTASPIRTP
jgi:hypothetical protein